MVVVMNDGRDRLEVLMVIFIVQVRRGVFIVSAQVGERVEEGLVILGFRFCWLKVKPSLLSDKLALKHLHPALVPDKALGCVLRHVAAPLLLSAHNYRKLV